MVYTFYEHMSYDTQRSIHRGEHAHMTSGEMSRSQVIIGEAEVEAETPCLQSDLGVEKASPPGNLQEQPQESERQEVVHQPECLHFINRLHHLPCGFDGVNQALCALFSKALKLVT